MSTNEQPIVDQAIAADASEIPEITEQQKVYIPPMGNAEFAVTCLSKAWDIVTDGCINIMTSDLPEEQKKKDMIALMHRLRESHIRTVQHTAEFIDNYEYHVVEQRNLDGVVEFLLHDLLIGIKNNYTAIPRSSLAERNPETDKDPNWQYTPLPVERIFRGERIPVKVQTNKQTIYGWYECLNHQIPNAADPTKLVNVQTTVPCIRLKKGQVAPNAAWRWQEISEERLKTHWLKGEDMVTYEKPKAKTEANPIEKAPETEGTENGNSTETKESSSSQ